MSASWLCSHKNRVILPYPIQVCEASLLLAKHGAFLKGKAKRNYTFRIYGIPCPLTLPTLQQGTQRVHRAEASGAPFFFHLQCKQGKFTPRSNSVRACVCKGPRLSDQAFCKNECRESLFAEKGSEEMRTSETETAE